LQAAGHEVSVVERETAAGGRMRSEAHGKFVIDRGAQFIASGYRTIHALAAEVGIADRIHSLARASNAILRDGELHPGDYDNLMAFARSRLVSWRTKLRLPRLLLEVWRHRRLLDAMDPSRSAALDGEPMPHYLRRVVGDEAFEYLLAPALSSTFDSDPEDLSGLFVQLTLSFVLRGFRLQSFAGGTGTLTHSLAQRLAVRSGWQVSSVEPSQNRITVTCRTASGEQGIEAERVVMAVPGSLVGGLCPSLGAEEVEFFSEVRYVRGIIVFLMTERAPNTLPYYGVAFPRREGLDLYGLAVDHHKAGVAPPGAGLLNTALTAGAARRVWDWSEQRIVDLVLDQLARTPIGRLMPSAAVVHRWDPMLPQFYPGYVRQLAAFQSRARRTANIEFAGDYLVGPYTEAAATSGVRAAAAL
jgi:oxygen-dependent protoporphyrinogen oxidase